MLAIDTESFCDNFRNGTQEFDHAELKYTSRDYLQTSNVSQISGKNALALDAEHTLNHREPVLIDFLRNMNLLNGPTGGSH